MLKTIVVRGSFEWDEEKESQNVLKHGVDFSEARFVFKDPHRIFIFDELHSQFEARYFCIGKVDGVVLTVRFKVHHKRIRIFGAARWRKWTRYYDNEIKKISSKLK
ncbi:BrnT family toxin [Bdellovibrio sp. HCB288]|uniref:BrnT family toxin n=1 Tax=Bdellovibrio sp. HCB288 TaxID=3394355 RepID=UPI0039B3CB1A